MVPHSSISRARNGIPRRRAACTTESDEAFVWVDAILGAMVTGWLLLAGLSAYFVLRADDPGTPMALFAVVLTGGAIVLLMVVLRALLRQATTLRTDMEAVI